MVELTGGSFGGLLTSGGMVSIPVKTSDYARMLAAVEQALKICNESWEDFDPAHQQICSDLRDARDQLLRLVDGSRGH